MTGATELHLTCPQPARFSLAVFDPGVGSGSQSESGDA